MHVCTCLSHADDVMARRIDVTCASLKRAMHAMFVHAKNGMCTCVSVSDHVLLCAVLSHMVTNVMIPLRISVPISLPRSLIQKYRSRKEERDMTDVCTHSIERIAHIIHTCMHHG